MEVSSEKSEEVYEGGKSKAGVPQTEQNDYLPSTLDAILCHKGKKIAKTEGKKEQYGNHIQATLEQPAEGNLVKAFLAGALDATIIACMSGNLPFRVLHSVEAKRLATLP